MMKYALFFILLILSLHCFAQCPFPVTLKNNGGICLGSDTLFVSGNNGSISKIVWYNGGTVDTTVKAAAGTGYNPIGVTVAGGNGQGAAANQFSNPEGVNVDANGYVYVADAINNRIQKFPPGSTTLTNGITVAGGNGQGAAANQLNYPAALFVDAAGNIYVADENNNRIQKFTAGSSSLADGATVAGGNGQGSNANQFNTPTSVFVDGSGNIYVTDDYNNRIQKFPSNSSSSTNGVTVAGGNGYGEAANQLKLPRAIYVDANGYIYEADGGAGGSYGRIKKFPPSSTTATNGVIVAGGNGAGSAPNQLYFPLSVYVDATGNIFVADASNNRVEKFPPNSTGATNGIAIGSGQLNLPASVWVDGAGNVFVADQDDNRIQKFSPFTIIDSIYIPSSPGTYTAVVTDSTGCTVTTNAITINPNVTPTLTISAVANTVSGCSASALDTVHFTATASNGGTTPAYQWKVNGANAGANSATFTAALPNNSVVTCTLTSNAVCAMPSTVTSNSYTVQFSTASSITLKNKGSICLGSGDTVYVSGGKGRTAQIIWYYNNNTDTVTAIFGTPNGGTIAGGNGQGQAGNQFYNPWGIYLDAAGYLYVADAYNNRIMKFPPGSTSATQGTVIAGNNGFGGAANQLKYPTALYVDASGNLFVTDNGNNRIQEFPPGSTSATNGITVAGGNGLGVKANQLDNPSGVFVDGSGSLYVADASNNRIQKFPPGSSSATDGVTVAGSNGQGMGATQLNSPTAVYVDAGGNVFVADLYNNRIQKFPAGSTSATNGITVAGGNGSGRDLQQFVGSSGVFVDKNGNIYATDEGNHRVVRFPPNSTSHTAGVPVAGGNGQGNALNQVSYPDQVFIDAAGSIYVDDNGNERIQKYPQGITATIDSTFVPTVPGTYTAVVSDTSGCATTTTAITIYGNVAPTISISYVANAVPVCSTQTLDTAHFTATASNAGTAAVYQWKVNGANAGTNSATFVANLANNSLVTCTVTSSLSCSSPSTATSNIDTVKFVSNPVSIKAVGGLCLGSDSLIVTGESNLAKITWYNGNTVDTTVNATPVTLPITNGITVAGGNDRGNAANQFNLPNDVFVDANNNIYVSDETNDRVQKFPPGSTSATNGTTVAGANGIGSAANQLQPNSVYVDGTGNIYVADNSNARVLKFPPGSTSLTNGVVVAGGNGQGSAANQFVNPVSIFLDASGNMYVVDAENNRLQKFPAGSTGATNATASLGNGIGSNANQFNGPASVFVDGSGNVYVADAANNRIQKFAPGAANGTTVAGGNGFGNAANQLSTPSSVWVDASGNIYVADVNNERIQKFAPGSTSATNGKTVAGGNGPGSAANQFSGPNSVSVDAAGNIYVSDAGNNRIQEFKQTPVTTSTIDTVFKPSTPGTYMAVVSDNAGCTFTTNAITILSSVAPKVNLSGVPNSTTSCTALDTVRVTATTTNGGSAPTYQWQVNGAKAGTDSAVLTAAMANGSIVTCTVTSNAACAVPATVTSAGFVANFGKTANDTLLNKGSVCLGSDTLVVSAGGGNIAKIVWYNGNTLDTTIVGTVTTDTISGGVTVAGGNGMGSAFNQFSTPNSVYVDAGGNIYVADLFNYRILKFPPGSTSATLGTIAAGGNGQGSGLNQFQPNSVFVDGSGNIFIADNENDRIMQFLPGSTGSTFGTVVAGGNGFGASSIQFNDPVSVCTDVSGNIYIVDASNQRIQKFPQGSTSLTSGVTVAGGNGQGSNANQLNGPSGVCVDGSGNIYVSDGGNHRVQKFTPGLLTGVTVAGGNGNGNAADQLSSPSSVFVDASGSLYVTDPQNQRVQKFPPGSTTTTNGITVAGGNGAGTGPNQFNYPFSVYVDASGAIYVAYLNNNRIQKFNQRITHQSVSDTTLVPSTPGTYTAVITDSAGCAFTTNAVVVNPNVAPSVSITATTIGQGACSLQAIDSLRFTAVATNGGTTPVYQWKVNSVAAGGDSSVYTGALANGNYVTCSLTSNAVCVTPTTIISNIDTVKISPPAPPTLASNGGICLGTASLVVSGGGPAQIVWYNGAAVDTTITASAITIANGVTVAGGNGSGSGADQLYAPGSIFLDAGGNLYVADEQNNRIQKFPAGSTSLTNGATVAGGNGSGGAANQFNSPHAAFIDATGNLYVADIYNNRIQKFPPGSTSLTNGVTVAGGNGNGNAANQLSAPASVFVDGSGNLYVADQVNSRIQKFPPNSTSLTNGATVAGGNGTGSGANQFNVPYFVYVDAGGNIYVADQANHRIQKFAPGSNNTTNGITVAGGNGNGGGANQLSSPISVYVDGGGDIYVADLGNNRIQKFLPGAANAITVGGGNGKGAAPNQLDAPAGVYVNGNGNVFVADQDNDRIQEFYLSDSLAIDTVYSPYQPGTYTAVVTTGAGCVDTTNAITINPSAKPVLSIDADTTTVCAGNTVTFTANATNAGTAPAYQWLLNGIAIGPNNPVYTSPALANGDAVGCIVTGGPGCFMADTSTNIAITVVPLPTVGPANDINISPGQSVTLTIPVTGNIATYLWQPPDGLSNTTVAAPLATPAKNTTYTLTVTATDGCMASGSITVKLAYPISIPSAFTPNGDGKNDVFYVLGGYTGDKIKDFVIYNRVGQKIFEQHNVVPNDPAFGWDGTYQGVQQPPAAYVYIVVITAADGTQKMFKGTVVMVR